MNVHGIKVGDEVERYRDTHWWQNYWEARNLLPPSPLIVAYVAAHSICFVGEHNRGFSPSNFRVVRKKPPFNRKDWL